MRDPSPDRVSETERVRRECMSVTVSSGGARSHMYDTAVTTLQRFTSTLQYGASLQTGSPMALRTGSSMLEPTDGNTRRGRRSAVQRHRARAESQSLPGRTPLQLLHTRPLSSSAPPRYRGRWMRPALPTAHLPTSALIMVCISPAGAGTPGSATVRKAKTRARSSCAFGPPRCQRRLL